MRKDSQKIVTHDRLANEFALHHHAEVTIDKNTRKVVVRKTRYLIVALVENLVTDAAKRVAGTWEEINVRCVRTLDASSPLSLTLRSIPLCVATLTKAGERIIIVSSQEKAVVHRRTVDAKIVISLHHPVVRQVCSLPETGLEKKKGSMISPVSEHRLTLVGSEVVGGPPVVFATNDEELETSLRPFGRYGRTEKDRDPLDDETSARGRNRLH